MPTARIILIITVMAICGGMEVMNCLELYENDPEKEREMQILCNVYPSLNICSEFNMEKQKSSYMRLERSLPFSLDTEPFPFEKRKSAYMRFGKREDVNPKDYVKRKSAYMRFGR
uniref:Uncharacterized protein n=1 Tax=Setaria digitata TaxID=48799 RepID=A0A915PQH2_9BILA